MANRIEKAIDNMVASMQSAAMYQVGAINAAANISKEMAEKNIALLEKQFGIARNDLQPLLAASQQGITAMGDMLGLNGAAAQQSYVNSLVQTGQAVAQPTLDLINSWNSQNNPVNMVSNLLGLQTNVSGTNFGSSGTNFQGSGPSAGFSGQMQGYQPSSTGPTAQSGYANPTQAQRDEYNNLFANGATPEAIAQAQQMQQQYGSFNLANFAGVPQGASGQSFMNSLANQGMTMEDYNNSPSYQNIIQQQQAPNQNRQPTADVVNSYQANLQALQNDPNATNAQGVPIADLVSQAQQYYGQALNPQSQSNPQQQGSSQGSAVSGYAPTSGSNIFTDLATSTGIPTAPDPAQYLGSDFQTAVGTPDAPVFSNIVEDVYNNPTLQAAIQQEIDYGSRNASNQMNAQGINMSGRQLEALGQLGQGMAQQSYADKLAQALGLASNNYNQQMSSDVAMRLGATSAAQQQYGTQLASDTNQRLAAFQGMLSAGQSAYNTNTAALTGMYGNAYQSGVGQNQSALGNLTNLGLGAAQSTANLATGLGGSLAGINQQLGSDLSNAALSSGNVMANMTNSMGNLMMQQALNHFVV